MVTRFGARLHVVVINDRSRLIGGASGLALLSARLMAALGARVTFITGDTGEDCSLGREGIDVVPLGCSPIEGSLMEHGVSGLHNRRAYSTISRFIAEHDTPTTVYHLHNWAKILSPAVFRALRPVSKRLLVSAHDFALVCPNLGYTDFQRSGQSCDRTPLSTGCLLTHCDRHSYSHKIWRVIRSVERRAAIDFSHAGSLVTVIHPDMIEYFVRGGIPRDRIRVVRNPVSPYRASRVTAEANADLFFIGRLVHEKGPDLAAEAARLAGRRLRMIGDGDMRDSLMQRYPEVVFEGWRSHEQISALVGDARALVLSSRLPETFTLVAHEAMRSGIPVVAFSDVDCREAAAIGAAIVVPPREASDLAAGIRVLDSDAAAARISAAAHTEGWRFSNTSESWRDALLKCYDELLNQTSSTIHHAALFSGRSSSLYSSNRQ